MPKFKIPYQSSSEDRSCAEVTGRVLTLGHFRTFPLFSTQRTGAPIEHNIQSVFTWTEFHFILKLLSRSGLSFVSFRGMVLV